NCCTCFVFFFSSRRRHTRFSRDWSSDVCSSDLHQQFGQALDQIETASDQPLVEKLQFVGQIADRTNLGHARAALERVQVAQQGRSEERRVGKESSSRRMPTQRRKS